MQDQDIIADSASPRAFESTSSSQASSRGSHRRRRVVSEGIETLGDVELLAIALGSSGGAAPVSTAAALVEELGIAGLVRAGLGELSLRRGMGTAKAARLVAAIELGRRAVHAASLAATTRLPDREAVEAWARPRLATLDHEELWALVLDGQNGLRAARLVASGGIHGLQVGVRDVLRVALREAASAFILVHNHPSGDPTPSQEDEVFTRAVTEAAKVVGCPMIDHVVIARQRSSSMFELIAAV